MVFSSCDEKKYGQTIFLSHFLYTMLVEPIRGLFLRGLAGHPARELVIRNHRALGPPAEILPWRLPRPSLFWSLRDKPPASLLRINSWDAPVTSPLGAQVGLADFSLCIGAGWTVLRIIVSMSAPRKADFSKSGTTFPQRSTVFAEYRRRTGTWPVLSMGLYAGRLILMFVAISFLFWYGRSHPATLSRTAIYFFLATLPVAFAWSIAESVAWNYDLRRKGLIPPQTILGVRQLPPE